MAPCPRCPPAARGLLALLLLLPPPVPGARGRCGAPPGLSRARPELGPAVTPDASGVQSFPIGTAVRYRCRDGFVKIPGKPDTAVCLPNAEWSPIDECCGPSCDAPPRFKSAVLIQKDADKSYYPVGTHVSYICRPGYESAEATRNITCLENLIWSEAPEFCRGKSCGVPKGPENGRAAVTTTDRFGAKVKIICDEGFKLFGQPFIFCVRKGDHVEWSELPTCQNIRCPVPQIQNGRRVSGDSCVYSYKDNVTFECDPSFTMKGHSLSQCQTDETWDPPVPVCEQVQRCPAPPIIDHGKPSVQAWDVFTSGMSVNYHCDPGYSFLGEASLHCTASGAWSHPLPQCEAKCVSPVVENGRTNGVQLAYRPGDIILFECNPGYTLSGSPETRCQDDGSWDPPIPICERRLRCPSPPSIHHGKPSGLALAVFTSGMSVNYSCEPGYSLTGQASIYCTASGTWSPLPPRCEVSHMSMGTGAGTDAGTVIGTGTGTIIVIVIVLVLTM